MGKILKGAKYSPSLFFYPYIYHLLSIHHLPYSIYTCISWFDRMTRFSRSMVWLCNKCLQVCIRCLPTYELHISLLEVGWEREGSATIPNTINTTYLERREKTYTIKCLGEDPEIPQRRELKGSYKGISEFYFENLTKLWNNSWSKSLRHGAWLDRSVFQLLKT
jgi:hypothetical protein